MNENLLPFSLSEIMAEELLRARRPNDHLLHASSHLTGSLRHAQLDVAGAPKQVNPLVSEIVMMTGTMWHDWLHNTMRRLGIPYMAEVNMTPWLPPGWAGTADGFVWNPDLKAFVLIDFKTTKGEGMRFIRSGGAKPEHIAQLSAYWYAGKKMGLPLAKQIAVIYIPKNDTRNRDELIEPVMVDFAPLPQKALAAEMKNRWGRVSEYVSSLGGEPGQPVSVRPLADWVTDALEPEQPREQRLYLDKASGTHDLKLVPHWSTAYCPYALELCACSAQGTTKIGFYDFDGTYFARPGYEDVIPTVAP